MIDDHLHITKTGMYELRRLLSPRDFRAQYQAAPEIVTQEWPNGFIVTWTDGRVTDIAYPTFEAFRAVA